MTPEEVEDIFTQGDIRYSGQYANVVADFFNEKALEIIKEDISGIEIENIDFGKINGPQKSQKAVATKIIFSKGLKLIGYERDIGHGRVDVLAQNKQNSFIAVECGPCRLTKLIDYFRWSDLEELWLISIYYNDEKAYFIKRGPNWDKTIKKYDDARFEQLRKIPNPLDYLNKN